ncbi:hypothetical protein PPSIR1_22159 [Plesiocystis pacifica SIR-1]|uniref:DUF2997 domain-containing protein n=1 Tax=Plesiocystis pacifica SIR-1 TaxID=391625 RepID=A6FXS9_9BACT|nr:DUF2997 domain-containing protein [Plesiocystis pacifica]EDM81667.1 hypothetical protein PPSIR1_22159 [Plesiocystis pacifica SIR-1]
MKEQRITIEIDPEGRITADADGFAGDACLRELDKLLDELAPTTATIERKPDAGPARVQASRTQTVGKKKR